VAYDRFILGHKRFSELDQGAFIHRDAAGGPPPADNRPLQAP
jgi:hypothetical protein